MNQKSSILNFPDRHLLPGSTLPILTVPSVAFMTFTKDGLIVSFGWGLKFGNNNLSILCALEQFSYCQLIIGQLYFSSENNLEQEDHLLYTYSKPELIYFSSVQWRGKKLVWPHRCKKKYVSYFGFFVLMTREKPLLFSSWFLCNSVTILFFLSIFIWHPTLIF